MKVLRLYAKKDLRYEDVPEPYPGPGQVKVKISLAGICGTDLREYNIGPWVISTNKVPLTIGHEFAGPSFLTYMYYYNLLRASYTNQVIPFFIQTSRQNGTLPPTLMQTHSRNILPR